MNKKMLNDSLYKGGCHEEKLCFHNRFQAYDVTFPSNLN